MPLPCPFNGNYPVTQWFGGHPEAYYQFVQCSPLVHLAGHEGIDFGLPTGTPVFAVDTGTVKQAATSDYGYGNRVQLIHAWGETIYAHLSAIYVAIGDSVQQGRLIGLSGWSGNVQACDATGQCVGNTPAGAHLHFGLRLNGYNQCDKWFGWVDPKPYLSCVGGRSDPGQRISASGIDASGVLAYAGIGVGFLLLLRLVRRH